MKKVVFFFTGTGASGEDYAEKIEEENKFNDDVIRVYFCGCQHDNVGKGELFPDLDIVANKIRKAFNKEDKTLDLTKLGEEMGDGVHIIGSSSNDPKVCISKIGLQGVSRGAVTTFAVAKKLDELDIGMDIIANQPVPGPRIFSKYNDLSDCKNIKSATTLIASHHLENDFCHNHFYHQMLSQFSKETEVKNLLMPHQTHQAWLDYKIVPLTICKLFIQRDYATTTHELDKADKALNNYILTKEELRGLNKLPDATQQINSDLIKVKYNEAFRELDISNLLDLQDTVSLKQRAVDTINDALKKEYQEEDLYFTPLLFMQKILSKGEYTVEQEPIFLELKKEKALNSLRFFIQSNPNCIKKSLEPNEAIKSFQELKNDLNNLTNEQISAVLTMLKVRQEIMTSKQKIDLINFIKNDKANGPKLTQIINRTTEVTDFLRRITQDEVDEEETSIQKQTPRIPKSDAIKKHTPAYCTAVFLESYNYLKKERPNKQEDEAFCNAINQAQCNFSNNALSIDRGLMRKAMKVITNSILHITGLFLIFNTLNKAITGNYLFFNQTRSATEVEKISKKTKEELLNIKSRLNAIKEEKSTLKPDVNPILEQQQQFSPK